jgi:hypothetical protein
MAKDTKPGKDVLPSCSALKRFKFRREGFEGALAGNFIFDFSAGVHKVRRGQKSKIKFSDEVPSEAAAEILAM